MAEEKSKFEFGASSIYGINEIIKMASPLNFNKWMEKTQKISQEDFNEGYKLFLETALRSMVDAIANHPLIRMEEDYVYFRARHSGIMLSKLPNTCNKIVFLKNFYLLVRKLRKTEKFGEIIELYKEIELVLLDPISEMINKESNLNKNKLSKEEVSKISMMYWTLIYFNQITNGIPEGYFVSCFPNYIRPKTYKEGLSGYSFVLEFIWYNLLGEEYKKYDLSNMHKVKSWDYRYEDLMEEQAGNKKEVLVLNKYFGIINDKIIHPLEKKYNFNIFASDVLYFDKKISPSYFKLLLKNVPEPKLSPEEKFEHLVFWYRTEVLNSRSAIFNGVATFMPLLIGIVERKQIYGIEEKSYVARFKHPDKFVNGNDFSYGLLIQSYGTFLSDFSGWIIFDDCCGDYSNFSGTEYAYAERIIKKYEELGLIEVRELEISRKDFKKYLSERVTKRNITQDTKRLKELQDLLGDAKGVLFELFSHYYTSKHLEFTELDWKIGGPNGDIDLEIINNKEKIFVECKLDPATVNIENEIKKLKKKVRGDQTGKNAMYEFWFWHPPTPPQNKVLINNKIKYRIISYDLEKNPDFNKDMAMIKNLFKKLD